jgi:predicted transcriptional regulator
MTFIRGYNRDLPEGKLLIKVDDKYNWYVEFKGPVWKPTLISTDPIWFDNRKWSKTVVESFGIKEDDWNLARQEIQANEADIENAAKDVEEWSEEIKKKAKSTLASGDPIGYFLDTFNKIHVGDRELGKVMMCCIGSQHCENSQGLHPKLSGESGMGKSDAIETFLHLLPKAAYLKTSMSSKAIFYHDIHPNTLIFLDDYKQNDELDSIIKQTSSNFHSVYEHRTIDKDRKSQVLKAPPGIVWAITSVDTSQDIQVLNRQVGLDVDSSEEMTRKVISHLLEAAGKGEERFPETEDVLVCRAMVAEIKANQYRVVIPFWDRIEWNDFSSRRNPSIFLDILKSVAIWRRLQRENVEDCIVATEEDFIEAKDLYVGRADTLIDKLTKAERRLIEVMVDEHGECYKEVAADKLGITSQRVSQLIHGEKGKTGILQKVPGFDVEDVLVKEDTRNVKKLNLRFANWRDYQRLQSYHSIVSLKKQDVAAKCKTSKAEEEAKTYGEIVSRERVVSKVSNIKDIYKGTFEANGKDSFSHISPETGLQAYEEEPAIESESLRGAYGDLTGSPNNGSETYELIQLISELERKEEIAKPANLAEEYRIPEKDVCEMLDQRGWVEGNGGWWSPPSRTRR